MKNKLQRVSVLHLICGLPGSGKTTLAKKIEVEENAIRLTPDEWIKDIWMNPADESVANSYRDQVEQLQWKIGKQILQAGVDVIIDWGTWGKEERKKLADEARQLGSKVKFYYLDTPKEVLKERIINRNKKLDQYEFFMSEDTLDQELDQCFKKMEVPDETELASYDFLG